MAPEDEALKPDWRHVWVKLNNRASEPERWLPGEVEADGSFVVPDVPPGDAWDRDFQNVQTPGHASGVG